MRDGDEILIPISLRRIRIKFYVCLCLTAGCAISGADGWLTFTLMLLCGAILLAAGIIGGKRLIGSVFFLRRGRGD
ncbi:hypothetical protein [Nonomuraea typhae]|uniref:DUF3040 domain-containing protein n=1 Tax=Nonomuraea typhae TaxID=2603600 RepID=A0ABW7Z774_9ACTN